ncbi:Uncharacterised protein [Mycobacteroides abscessus subsp. massiliense]|nr:Uncharacterised protein [Mycobacteroides abscessus subsp. massiliense]
MVVLHQHHHVVDGGGKLRRNGVESIGHELFEPLLAHLHGHQEMVPSRDTVRPVRAEVPPRVPVPVAAPPSGGLPWADRPWADRPEPEAGPPPAAASSRW